MNQSSWKKVHVVKFSKTDHNISIYWYKVTLFVGFSLLISCIIFNVLLLWIIITINVYNRSVFSNDSKKVQMLVTDSWMQRTGKAPVFCVSWWAFLHQKLKPLSKLHRNVYHHFDRCWLSMHSDLSNRIQLHRHRLAWYDGKAQVIQHSHWI